MKYCFNILYQKRNKLEVKKLITKIYPSLHLKGIKFSPLSSFQLKEMIKGIKDGKKIMRVKN